MIPDRVRVRLQNDSKNQISPLEFVDHISHFKWLECDSHRGVQILRTLGFVDRDDGG
ncbi:MAG: hypothetical protein KAI07_10285 [Deltaproteobacteria bacterium]|nr:hypothetical protein [Deltaproteobacteria bacterium]